VSDMGVTPLRVGGNSVETYPQNIPNVNGWLTDTGEHHLLVTGSLSRIALYNRTPADYCVEEGMGFELIN